MNISVALATFNGEKYIRLQIDSILNQLGPNDELIISDDGSTDKTISIINSYLYDGRVHVYINPYKGVIRNFENAISKTTNDIIFLCDQDDVWLPNKVNKICEVFKNKETKLVISNIKIVDAELQEYTGPQFEEFKWGKGIFKNLLRNSYIGCTMAFRKEVKDVILPFPNSIPMHDSWIGILSEINRFKITYIPEKLMLYRRHVGSFTGNKKNKISQKVKWRFCLVYHLILRQINLYFLKERKS